MSTSHDTLEQRLLNQFCQQLPGQAALTLEAHSGPAVSALLQSVDVPPAARTLGRLNADLGAVALGHMGAPRAAALVERLDAVRAGGLLARMPAAQRDAVSALLPPAVARDLREVAQCSPGTAGALMDVRVATFLETASVRDTLERVRTVASRRLSDLVIASPDNDFIGVVSLQQVVGAEPTQALSELVQRGAPHVPPMAPQDDVVEAMARNKLVSLPVVGVDGKVLGIIRNDALMNAAQQVVGQDMQQMVGASAEERALSSPWFSVKSRLPWLQINLLTAFLASAVVGLFDATIAQFTALAVLMPVVAGQSGNTGAQALAVTARGLALREIRTSHVWRVLGKELVAALINGAATASVTSLGVFLWSGSAGLAFVIGTSMVMSMVLAALAGGAIPIILTALNRDPATASSIILTTVTDVCGFFSFLGLATLLSSWIEAG